LQEGSRGAALLVPLRENSNGTYLGTLPPGLRGEVAAQIDFEHAGARLSKRLLLSLP